MSAINHRFHLESIIERILRDLEEKERIFETYKVASGSNIRFQTRSIIDFIDFEMNRVIRVPLYQIYDVDPSLCEMLCNAFFGRTKCWKREGEMPNQGYDVDVWPSCRFHLYAGTLCMYACVVMERLFKGVHDEYQAAAFTENRCFFEERSLKLLNDVFRKNANIAINAIEIDYEKIFKLGEDGFFGGAKILRRTNTYPKRATTCWGGCCRVQAPWSVRSDETSIELMAVAYRAKAMVPYTLKRVSLEQKGNSLTGTVCMNFLAHNCCQSLIERRWHGRLRLSPTRTFISYIFPCFLYKEYTLRRSRCPDQLKGPSPDEKVEMCQDPPQKDRGTLLTRLSEIPAFSRTVDLDSPTLVPCDAVTPDSYELEYLNDTRPMKLPKIGSHVMMCSAPKFPIRDQVSTNQSPLSSDDRKRDDGSYIYEGHERNSKCPGRMPSWLWSTLKFYSTTKAKFFYHVIFRILYVAVYGWVLVAKTRKRSPMPNFSVYWPELVVALVQLSQLCDCVVAIRERMPSAKPVYGPWLCNISKRYKRKLRRLQLGFFEWTSDHLFGFCRNVVIIMNCITVAAVVIHAGHSGEVRGFWAALATISDLIFHISFLFAAISMIRYLSVFYFFSVLTYMLRRMIRTLGKFLLIFVIFWVIFAVCHISMAEEYAVRSNHSLAWMMFQNGAFEIFGEVDDEDKVGTVTGCADISWRSMWSANTADMRCLFRSALIPITVFTYMLVASIMLVNLLTALLSKEYEEVSGGGSAVYWKYENYFLLATYESKLWLPPPLSLIYYILHMAPFLFRIFSFFFCIFCTCCSNMVIKNNPFSFIPNWLDRVFRAIEGRPWGTLKQMRRHVHDQSDLEEIRKLVPILMECINDETGQIRTRANTAMEELQQMNCSFYNSLPNFKSMESTEIFTRPRFYQSELREHSAPDILNPSNTSLPDRIYRA
uniref:G protein-coupled receptor n=1 Tax=Haemonchus contortus TaxID=6289 RepID=A0A7I5EBI7_HAECO